MRLGWLLVVFFAFSALAVAQMSGLNPGYPAVPTAGDLPPAYAPYYAPAVVPSGNPYMPAVGARSGTGANVVGARTSTLTTLYETGASTNLAGYANPSYTGSIMVGMGFDTGTSAFIGTGLPRTEPSLVEAAHAARQHQPGKTRLYTNRDISALGDGHLNVPPPSTSPFVAPYTMASITPVSARIESPDTMTLLPESDATIDDGQESASPETTEPVEDAQMLPPTATFLPALALAGLSSITAGLLLIRYFAT